MALPSSHRAPYMSQCKQSLHKENDFLPLWNKEIQPSWRNSLALNGNGSIDTSNRSQRKYWGLLKSGTAWFQRTFTSLAPFRFIPKKHILRLRFQALSHCRFDKPNCNVVTCATKLVSLSVGKSSFSQSTQVYPASLLVHWILVRPNWIYAWVRSVEFVLRRLYPGKARGHILRAHSLCRVYFNIDTFSQY